MTHAIVHYSEWTDIWCESEEFSIDQIPDTPESECEGEYRHERISNIKNRIFFVPSEEKYCEYYSDCSTMETHPSLPDLKDFHRMFQEIWKIIEDDVAESSPQYHAEKEREEKSVDISFTQEAISFHIFITRKEAKSIHESIPCRSDCQT